MTLEQKVATVEEIVRGTAPVLVAYSGGVDSTCLLALAHRAAPGGVLGVIADSPSLPREALRRALGVAESFGAPVEVVATRELEEESYASNPPNRCYFCKAELFARLEALAGERGFRALAYGENADDRADLRPGSRAAREFRVLAPLREAGLAKAEIRALSRQIGLPTHDDPAQPCLSSRIPHGTRVTPEALALVERGEEFIRSLGFKNFRVRYVEGSPADAKLQVAPDEMARAVALQAEIEFGLRQAGFGSAAVDPAGYRPS